MKHTRERAHDWTPYSFYLEVVETAPVPELKKYHLEHNSDLDGSFHEVFKGSEGISGLTADPLAIAAAGPPNSKEATRGD